MDDGPPTAAYQQRLAPSGDSIALARYAWGARTPAILEYEKLRLVRDPFEPSLGPAWWVRMAYNKTVVLPEHIISRSDAASDQVSRNFYPDTNLGSDEEAYDEGEDGRDGEEGLVEDERGDDKLGSSSKSPGQKMETNLGFAHGPTRSWKYPSTPARTILTGSALLLCRFLAFPTSQ